LKEAVRAGVKYFVFSSTAAVYGNPQTPLMGEETIPRSDCAWPMQARRAGDRAAIVGDVQTIRRILSWTPTYDDIETIVRHALGAKAGGAGI
jgi:UDP-glucose 4-epimerase